MSAVYGIVIFIAFGSLCLWIVCKIGRSTGRKEQENKPDWAEYYKEEEE